MCRLEPALEPYVHPHVLVVDELGYESYAADAANVLFRVANARHMRRRTTLVTTIKPHMALGQVLHDPDIIEAILDWLLDQGVHFVLRGRSYQLATTRRISRTHPGTLRDLSRCGRVYFTENPRQNPENPHASSRQPSDGL